MKELPVHCACFVSASDLFDSLDLRGNSLCVAHENITDGPATFGHGAVKVCLVDQEYLATTCDISPTAGDDAGIFMTCRAESRAEAKKKFEADAPLVQQQLFDYRFRVGEDPAPLPTWPGIKWRN